MKITKEMVNELNTKLKSLGAVVMYKFQEDTTIGENPMIKLTLTDMSFVDNCILNMTNEFYNYVENFFAEYGIKLTYNNTRSIAWSNDWS